MRIQEFYHLQECVYYVSLNSYRSFRFGRASVKIRTPAERPLTILLVELAFDMRSQVCPLQITMSIYIVAMSMRFQGCRNMPRVDCYTCSDEIRIGEHVHNALGQVIVELKMFGLLDANYVVLRFAYELTFVWDATQKFVPDRISLMNAWFFTSELVQL